MRTICLSRKAFSFKRKGRRVYYWREKKRLIDLVDVNDKGKYRWPIVDAERNCSADLMESSVVMCT